MNLSIDKTINIQTFESIPNLFDENKNFEYIINRNFNDRKYFHIIWNLLHLISVEYPNFPTEQQKQNLIEFIRNFKKFSCISCRKQHYVSNEQEINNAILSKNNFIQFLIDYHKNTNSTIRRYNVNNIIFDYTVDFIIKKYKDNDYKNYFKTTYDVDVEQLIMDANLNIIYDKLINIKKNIKAEKNIEITFSHKLN